MMTPKIITRRGPETHNRLKSAKKVQYWEVKISQNVDFSLKGNCAKPLQGGPENLKKSRQKNSCNQINQKKISGRFKLFPQFKN